MGPSKILYSAGNAGGGGVWRTSVGIRGGDSCCDSWNAIFARAIADRTPEGLVSRASHERRALRIADVIFWGVLS